MAYGDVGMLPGHAAMLVALGGVSGPSHIQVRIGAQWGGAHVLCAGPAGPVFLPGSNRTGSVKAGGAL